MPEETKHPTCNYFTIRLVSQIVQRWCACWMYLLGLVKSIWHDKSLGLAAETTRLWISKRRASVVSGLSLWKIPTCTVWRYFITSWRNHVWRPTRVNLRTPALLVILQRHIRCSTSFKNHLICWRHCHLHFCEVQRSCQK